MTETNDVRTITTKGTFTFKLTQKEVADKGRQMAEMDRELGEMSREFDAAKQTWKGRIAAKEDERWAISRTVRHGEEDREVECVAEYDYRNNAVRYVYRGEVLLERVMTQEERQTELDLRAKEKIRDVSQKAVDGLEQLIRDETGMRTKHSSLDGPVA